MRRLALLALVLLTLLAAPAVAQEATRPPGVALTQRGRMLASGRVMGFWSNDTPQYYAGNNTWSLRADPAITYFLRDHLGLGAALSFGWSRDGLFPRGEYRTRDFALGGEFVWSAALAPRWRLLVRPFVGYVRQWSSSRVPADSTLVFGVDAVSSFLRLSASLPIIYALNEHVGLGLAPEYLLDLAFLSSTRSVVRGAPSEGIAFSSPHVTDRVQFGVSLGLYASF